MKRKLSHKYKADSYNLIQENEIPLFVIYARKSTDESSEKQTASIPQQIEKCKERCEKENIPLMPRPRNYPIDDRTIKEIEEDNVSNPERAKELIAYYIQNWIITERASAKEPFQRQIWRDTLKRVQNREIRALMSYSPDRMSRNLQEGGELIQLVDKKFLALRFATFHFEDNAAGHMMLGFWLVFAEHYSRKLREDVLRGSEKKHQEGYAIGTRKYGYIVNTQDLFEPDPFHFPILQKAFKRKLYDYWSDEKIAEEMNKAGWRQVLKKYEGQDTKMSSSKISNTGLWYDPFYYGLYVKEFNNVKAETDLRALNYPNYTFQPLLSEEEWEQLQRRLEANNRKELKKRQSIKGKELDPIKPMPDGLLRFKGGASFSFMLPNRQRFDKKAQKEGKKLEEVVKPEQIRYRSQSSNTEKGLELKWSQIDKLILNSFQNIKISEEDYQAYLFIKVEELKTKSAHRERQEKTLNLRISTLQVKQKAFNEETNMGIGLTGKQKKFWEQKDQTFENEIRDLENFKRELRNDTRDIIAEQREFCELMQSLPKLWQKATYVQKRQILEILVLNIEVNAKKELQLHLKPEIESLFIRSGGDAGN